LGHGALELLDIPTKFQATCQFLLKLTHLFRIVLDALNVVLYSEVVQQGTYRPIAEGALVLRFIHGPLIGQALNPTVTKVAWGPLVNRPRPTIWTMTL
jgi:hypothetical protein